MGKGNKMVILVGLGLASAFGIGSGISWAGVPAQATRHPLESAMTSVSEQIPVMLARRGNRDGGGRQGNRWRGGNNTDSRRGYGAQDGTGSAPRARDGSGYGARKGTRSGDCDGSGPKGKDGGTDKNK